MGGTFYTNTNLTKDLGFTTHVRNISPPDKSCKKPIFREHKTAIILWTKPQMSKHTVPGKINWNACIFVAGIHQTIIFKTVQEILDRP